MKKESKYRIDGFEQIKLFFNWVEDHPGILKPAHLSLYFFLFHKANLAQWNWFSCPFSSAMKGSGIGSSHTYYKCIEDLQIWGFVEYKKGSNNYSIPLINIIGLSKNAQADGECLSKNAQADEECLSKNAQCLSKNAQAKEECLSKNANIYSNNNNNNNNITKEEGSLSLQKEEPSLSFKNSSVSDQSQNSLFAADIKKLVSYFSRATNPNNKKEFLFPDSAIPVTEEGKLLWFNCLDTVLHETGCPIVEIQNAVIHARTDLFWKKFITDLTMINEQGPRDRKWIQWLIADIKEKERGNEKTPDQMREFERQFVKNKIKKSIHLKQESYEN
ncbi:MAG TPA: hypothetical protein VK213_13520 [Bacteroidales bacterium]|nr:hypothetical protein [Bacteroidales bacterium]